MGLIERLPQQPHHIRLKTHDKESRTGILRPLEWGWVVTSGNISTGNVPILVREGHNSSIIGPLVNLNGSIDIQSFITLRHHL